MKNEDTNFSRFQKANESILNQLKEESLSNNKDQAVDEYLSSSKHKYHKNKSMHGIKATDELNSMYQQFKIKQSNQTKQGQNQFQNQGWQMGDPLGDFNQQLQNSYFQNSYDYQNIQLMGGNMPELIQACYFQQPNDQNKKQQVGFNFNQFNQKLRRSIKTSQQGKPYNTHLKQEIMKRN